MDFSDLLKMYELAPKPSEILARIRCSPGMELKMRGLVMKNLLFPEIFATPVIVSKWIPVNTAIFEMADGSMKILKIGEEEI